MFIDKFAREPIAAPDQERADLVSVTLSGVMTRAEADALMASSDDGVPRNVRITVMTDDETREMWK